MAAEETGRAPQWPRAAASAAIFRGQEVLLVRRGKGGPLAGLWSLPGGHIEPGEPARAAALPRSTSASSSGVSSIIQPRR